MSDVHERLRRLLFVVPYVARHRGVTVDALAKQLGVSREELLRDLELLTMVGRPPFQPDDFINLHVENDQVWVDLDQRFSKPPRLTGPEAAALAAAAELLRPAAQTALASALAKLEKILPASAKKMYRELGSAVNARSQAPEELGILTRAVEERRELEFDYAAPGKHRRRERRRVEPVEVFNHRGHWYLYGWDLGRGSERLFRLDRMTGIRPDGPDLLSALDASGPRARPGRARGGAGALHRPGRAVPPRALRRRGPRADRRRRGGEGRGRGALAGPVGALLRRRGRGPRAGVGPRGGVSRAALHALEGTR